MVSHMAEFLWELIYVLHQGWSIKDDLRHLSGALVLTCDWSTQFCSIRTISFFMWSFIYCLALVAGFPEKDTGGCLSS